MTALSDLVQRLDGHDGSHYQPDAGPVNWDQLDAAIWWLGWKCTQSIAYYDETFSIARQQAASRQGIEMFYPYHWLSSTTDVGRQAEWYLKSLHDHGGPLGKKEGAMIDAEEKGITEGGAADWLDFVESETKKASDVYTGLYVAGGSIWRSERIRFGGKFGPRTMHVAAYVSPTNLWSRMHLLGVDQLATHAWQYSSNGPCPGIVGRADLNSIIDKAAFVRALGLGALPALHPINDINMEDDNVEVSKVRFEGYGNVFLLTSAGYVHLTEKLANEKFGAIALEEIDAHPQGMLAAATQNGMRWDDQHKDWVADDGSGPKAPTYA